MLKNRYAYPAVFTYDDEVFMPAVRERVNSKFVKKTLSLPAWLAAKADEDGVNCSKLFPNTLLEYLHIENESFPKWTGTK